MYLRKLEMDDAVYMLEWMHDKNVIQNLQANFEEKTLEDCKKFISNSQDEYNKHFAIVDDSNTYMGTVSLKHINKEANIAEFAITIRSVAMGKGYSKYAMKEIIRIGIEELGLEKIYWCVSKNNIRAIKFYNKNGYRQLEIIPDLYYKNYKLEQLKTYFWYEVDEKIYKENE